MGTDERLRAILEAAVNVFVRYGFRKTSMDEVAKAASLSRQGLYLHFATKEELFRAALRYALESSLRAACTALADEATSLESRVTQALDEWVGRYVGMATGNASDLAEASSGVLGPMLSEHETQFVEALAKTLRTAGLPSAYKAAGLTARQLAGILYATARGLKHSVSTRTAFVEEVAVAVRALCFPLRATA